MRRRCLVNGGGGNEVKISITIKGGNSKSGDTIKLELYNETFRSIFEATFDNTKLVYGEILVPKNIEECFVNISASFCEGDMYENKGFLKYISWNGTVQTKVDYDEPYITIVQSAGPC